MEPKHTNLDSSTFQHVVLEKSKSEHINSVNGSGTACGSSNVPTPSNVKGDDDDIDDLENPFGAEN